MSEEIIKKRIRELPNIDYNDDNYVPSDSDTYTGRLRLGDLSNNLLNKLSATNPIIYNTTTRVIGLQINSTNLIISGGALNTVQNIATNSIPIFAQLVLSNQATGTNHSVRADRVISTNAPLTGGGNLTDNRSLGLNYSATNFKLTSNALDTIQDIDTTSSPAFRNLYLPNQADSADSSFGIIYKGTTRFIHNFRHPTGNTARPLGRNLFVGLGAGNLTMGATATATSHASDNIGIGENALTSITTGYNLIAIGTGALSATTTGYDCFAVGRWALSANTTGAGNVSIFGMTSNTTGNSNIAIGTGALNNNTTGSANIAIGSSALAFIQTNSDNIGIGFEAGAKNADNSNKTSGIGSIYLGAYSKALANGTVSEIVIGNSLTGKGSNTATIACNSGFYPTGDILLDTSRMLYLAGNLTTNGSWRMRATLSGNLIIEYRDAGNWIVKQTYTP